jgi:hypothetical protein
MPKFQKNVLLPSSGYLSPLARSSSVTVGFDFVMAVNTKMAVFWVVAPCGLGVSLLTFQRAVLPPSSGPDDGDRIHSIRHRNPENSHLL